MTDNDLLQALRHGSEDAFDTIFRAHYARLVQLAERMLGERAPAEEVVQDVMLELWRRRESLNVDTSLQGYLFRSVRNRTLNYLRHETVARRGAGYAAPPMAVAPTGDREIVEKQIDLALQRAVRDLPPRCREVFELSRMHGLKYAEIADTLGISIKTVEAQMGKALRTLRERMSKWLPASDL